MKVEVVQPHHWLTGQCRVLEHSKWEGITMQIIKSMRLYNADNGGEYYAIKTTVGRNQHPNSYSNICFVSED